MSDKRLIDVEEISDRAGILNEQYDRGLLKDFIKEYDIRTDNVESLNIRLLLSEYEKNKGHKDVSDIFESRKNQRRDNFTDNARAIAYIDNDGTDILAAYLDIKELILYKMNEASLFNDISKGEAKKLNSDDIIERLAEAGLFDRNDESAGEGEDDGSCICIAVKYDDDSVFIRYYTDSANKAFQEKRELFEEILRL